MRSHIRTLLVTVIAGLPACSPERPPVASAHTARDSEAARPPGYVVDSARTVEEELRRFRVGLGPAPTRFAGGASSREALVRRYFDALASADTTALRGMLITRGEFAALVYPSSAYAHPPYQHPPGLVWSQLQSSSSTGLGRLLERARDYRYVSHRCDTEPAREGDNLLWRRCVTRVVRSPGDTIAARMFGVIVQRDGQFKFASYETDF